MKNNKTKILTKLFFTIFMFFIIFTIGLFSGNSFLAKAAYAVELADNSSNVPKVRVGGNSIGILLKTDGATVVGYAPVVDKTGKSLFPAKNAGIKLGDFIVAINDKSVSTDAEIESLINKFGKKNDAVSVKICRDGEYSVIPVRPIYCYDSASYRIGLYIRDNTAGVGTLTYYDPKTKIYGALGHEIDSTDSKISRSSSLGSILDADIQSIKAGKKGSPGEKIGVFENSGLKGTIEKNNDYGIFGHLSTDSDNEISSELIPVATVDQIQEGSAQILTVLDNDKVQAFNVNIIKVFKDNLHTNKNLIVQVTDENLINTTGGIIQGMSGSPIIQNGRLVGAVTHVFVNDPTRGYGCFAMKMMQASKSL